MPHGAPFLCLRSTVGSAADSLFFERLKEKQASVVHLSQDAAMGNEKQPIKRIGVTPICRTSIKEMHLTCNQEIGVQFPSVAPAGFFQSF